MDRAMAVAGRGLPTKLEVCRIEDKTIVGDFVKIRTENLGERAPLDGPCTPITHAIGDDGIGACVAFVYHIPTNLLAIQFNRQGPSMTAISGYLLELTGKEITFSPALMKEKFAERLKKMTASTVTMKLVSVDPLLLFGEDAAAELRTKHADRVLEIEMSVRIRNVEDTTLEPATMKKMVESHRQAKVADMKVLGIGKSQDEEDRMRTAMSGDYVHYEKKLKSAVRHMDHESRLIYVRDAIRQKGQAALDAIESVKASAGRE